MRSGYVIVMPQNRENESNSSILIFSWEPPFLRVVSPVCLRVLCLWFVPRLILINNIDIYIIYFHFDFHFDFVFLYYGARGVA